MTKKLLFGFSIIFTLFSTNLFGAKSFTVVASSAIRSAYLENLAKAYEKNTGISVAFIQGNATKGLREVAQNRSDLGVSNRLALPHIEEQHLLLEPYAWDAIVVVTHRENRIKNMALPQIQKIFSGAVSNWKQLAGANGPLHIYTHEDKSAGIEHHLQELLFAATTRHFAAHKKFKETLAIERAVEQDIFGIAVSSISSARHRELNILSVEGVAANYENIKKGTYPLFSPVYLAMRANEQRREVLNFIRFMREDEGRDILRKAGIVPYLEAVDLVIKRMSDLEQGRDMGLFPR